MTTISAPPSRGWLHSRRVWLVALVVLVGVAFPVGLQFRPGGLGGSAGSASIADVGSVPEHRPATAAPGADAASGSAADTTAQPAGAAGDAPVVGPKLARSAWLGIKVGNLVGASGEVRSLTAAAGGQVLSESVVTAPDPTGGPQVGASVDSSVGSTMPQVGVDEARLTVRVPAEKLDGLVADLSRIGAVSYRSSQSEDLTDSYVDVSARIGPMRDAVTQARALLAKATNLSQIIQLENEVTRRQADLDSLESRLATLDRRTTTSDVTVSLWTGSTPAPPVTTGFVGQLREAWTGLLDSVAVLITGLAVILPWLLVLAVLVFVGRRWWGRRGAGVPQAPATAGPPAGGPAD